METEKEDQ